MSDSDQGARVLEEIVTASVEGLGLAATVVVEDGPEGGLIARITGDDVDVLVERNGEVLDAVQSLAAQAVRRIDGNQRRGVLVDANDHRAKRVELDPMSAMDRRTVHMALADREGIETRSEGEDPRRRIVVVPADAE